MKVERSERGFEFLMHEGYPPDNHPEPIRLASCSSAIDAEAPDGFDNPGSSFLWIGDNHHLNREQVAQFVNHLTLWLGNGKLSGGKSGNRKEVPLEPNPS